MRWRHVYPPLTPSAYDLAGRCYPTVNGQTITVLDRDGMIGEYLGMPYWRVRRSDGAIWETSERVAAGGSRGVMSRTRGRVL